MRPALAEANVTARACADPPSLRPPSLARILLCRPHSPSAVQSTSTLPQTAFPLPFFLHFALVSARLLHFILALWAISNPRREFVPAAGRRPSEAAAGRNGDDEREGLLAGAEEAAVGGEGPGYGTFAEGEQAEGST